MKTSLVLGNGQVLLLTSQTPQSARILPPCNRSSFWRHDISDPRDRIKSVIDFEALSCRARERGLWVVHIIKYDITSLNEYRSIFSIVSYWIKQNSLARCTRSARVQLLCLCFFFFFLSCFFLDAAPRNCLIRLTPMKPTAGAFTAGCPFDANPLRIAELAAVTRRRWLMTPSG